MSITSVNYAFSSAGLLPALAEKHATFAARALAATFNLPTEKVHITYRNRLPENAPFQLSCYQCKNACPLALVKASRRVLPHLRRQHRYAVQGPAQVAAWEPGIELLLDDDVLEMLAAGVELPTEDTREQWLHAHVAAAAQPSKPGTPAKFNRPKLQLSTEGQAFDIGQVAAALLEHRRAEVRGLLAKGAK